jgi:probable HAF family extracellular repeat protein
MLNSPVLKSLLAITLYLAPAAAQSYTVVDLGTLSTNPSHAVRAVAINDRGHVHGTNELNGAFGTPKTHSFLWDGALQHIWPIMPAMSLGGGVNDMDQVVGHSSAGPTKIHGYLWQSGLTSDIHAGLLSFSHANDINRAGFVCGDNSMFVPGEFVAQFRAYLRQPSGTWSDLGTLGGTRAFGTALNDKNEVIGTSTTDLGETHGFVTLGGGPMVDLGLLAGNFINPREINDSSEIAGLSASPAGALRPVRWRAGNAVDLGTLGGNEGRANGISDLGAIVGSTDDSLGQQRATRWLGAGPEDLNLLIPTGTGWFLDGASDINNLGEICGTGTLGGVTRAYRLTPVLSAPRLSGFQPAIAGASSALFGLGFQPGATVFLIYGFAAGSTPVPGCPGLNADIAAPLILTATPADADGRIELPLTLPAGITGLGVLLQAVDPVNCTVSELSTQTFL